MVLSILTMWLFSELFLMFLPLASHKQFFKIPEYPSPTFPHPILVQTDRSDYTLSYRVHVCSSEHSDLSFVYRFTPVYLWLGYVDHIRVFYETGSASHNISAVKYFSKM